MHIFQSPQKMQLSGRGMSLNLNRSIYGNFHVDDDAFSTKCLEAQILLARREYFALLRYPGLCLQLTALKDQPLITNYV